MPLPIVELIGMPIAAVRRSELLDHIDSELRENRGGWLLTANLDYLERFATDSETAALLRQSDVIVADGMPLLWAACLQGSPLPERLAGSDLVGNVAERAAGSGRSLALLGGKPGVAEEAARRFRARHPALRIAGVASPQISSCPSSEELAGIHEWVAERRPDMVLVAFGAPKEERLIAALRPAFPGSWWIGIGISLSFVSGDVSRAPRWLRKLGLEWLHRMLQEPRRLAGRYLLRDLPFLFVLLYRALRRRVRGGDSSPPA